MFSKTDYERSLGLDIVEADPASVFKQLEFMFGGLEDGPYRNGRIEVGSTAGECRFFKLSQFDQIADYVVERTRNGEKTYIHAGLIRPNGEKVQKAARGERAGHSKGADVLCWTVLWGEADHVNLEYDRALKGRKRLKARIDAFAAAADWGFVYATGTVPSLRLQGLIRLDQPAAPDDLKFWSVLKSITHNGKLDAGANNSSQLVRLAGSVSFASGEQKKAEAGEAPRITEPVRIAGDKGRKYVANLDKLHSDLDAKGRLIEGAPKGKLHSAKDIADLMAKVKQPKDSPDLDKDDVEAFVKRQVANARELESGGKINRRSGVLQTAKTIGGYLWTGHVDPEDIVGNDEDWSLVEAYHENGGAADNGENNIAGGIIDAMATGAAMPLSTICRKESDTSVFGDVSGDGNFSLEGCQAKLLRQDMELGLLTPEEVDIEARVAAIMQRCKKGKLGHFGPLADMAGTADAFELAGTFKQKEYVVHKLVPDRSVTLIYAAANTGKTFFTTEAMDSVQRGRQFLGFDAVKGGAIAFLSEGQAQFSGRVAALFKQHPIECGDRAFGVNGQVPVVDLKNPAKTLRYFVEAIVTREVTTDQKMKLVVIDGLAAMLGGDADENAAADMKVILRMLSTLAHVMTLAIVVIHHENAGGGSRGSTVIRAGADNMLRLKERGAGLVDLFLNKMRDDEKTDAAALTFRLVSVEIGIDNFGHAATSAVVELHLPGARMVAADNGDDQPELPSVPPTLRDVKRLELRELHQVFVSKGVGFELAMADVRAGVHAVDLRAGRKPAIDRTLKRWLDTLIQLDVIEDNGKVNKQRRYRLKAAVAPVLS